MTTIEELILTSVLQAEGEQLPTSISKLIGQATTDPICTALAGALDAGKIPTLTDLAALLPSSEIIRLSSLHVGAGLPLALAEIEAEKMNTETDARLRAQRLAELAAQAAERPDTSEDIRAELEMMLAPAVEPEASEMRGLVREGIDRWEQLHQHRGKTGVMTGFTEFDRISGGLKPGQMTVIAAETGGGKSTFALNVVNHALTQGIGVLLVTLEMDRNEIIDLLFAMNCRINRNGFNTGKFTTGEMQNAVANTGRMSKVPLFIEDGSANSATEIAAKIRSLSGSIGLVVVDYIQIVEPRDWKDSREQQIAAIAQTLSKSAKQSRVPMLALSQLNEDGKLRESRVIGHAACNVILLKAEKNEMKCQVVKGRFIPKIHFNLFYEPEFCILRDAARIAPEDANWQSNYNK